jgi:activator of HSP90 ATPase
MSIHQEIELSASPERVYESLLSSKSFAEATGAPAEIDSSAGGAFSCFGGQTAGRNIELVPNRRIVQAWRAGMWPEGTYSIVKFELQANDSGTKLTMDHSAFPEEGREHLNSGWHQMYWEPLKKYLT